jgi:hypothetical protein
LTLNLAKNKMMQRRGLSTIVATVLIILITIAVAGMIGAFVVPYVRDNLQKSTECVPYQEYFQFEDDLSGQNNNCYQQIGSGGPYYLGASVKAEAADKDLTADVKEIKIVYFTQSETSTTVSVVKNAPYPGKNSGAAWMIQSSSAIKLPSPSEVISYSYNTGQTTSSFVRAEVYPVLNSGRICPVSSKIEIKQCNAGVNLNA